MSKGGVITPIDQKIRDEAQSLYMKFWGPAEIARHLGQNYQTVKKWVTRYGWYEEREGIALELTEDLAKRRSHQINKIMKDSFEGIADTVSRFRDKGMSIKEATEVAKMLGDLDKIVRLAEGKATEIREERSIETQVHFQKVIDVLRSDPFTQLPENIEVNQIKDVGGNEKD